MLHASDRDSANSRLVGPAIAKLARTANRSRPIRICFPCLVHSESVKGICSATCREA